MYACTHPCQEEASQLVCHPGFLEQPVEAVLSQVLDVGAVQQGALNVCTTEQPAHVCMEKALVGGVQVQGGVAVQVVVPAASRSRARISAAGLSQCASRRALLQARSWPQMSYTMLTPILQWGQFLMWAG